MTAIAATRRRLVRLQRDARRVLAVFVAALVVATVAPFVNPIAFDLVCAAEGTKLVAHDAHGEHDGSAPAGFDHAAHCPLCVPGGAPPTVAFVWDATSAPPLAHVRRGIPTARLASLVGAPLPPRGPPPVV